MNDPGWLLSGVNLSDKAIVEKLRRLGGLRLGDGFREEIQHALQPWFRSDQLAAKAGLLVEFVTAVENFWSVSLAYLAMTFTANGLSA